MLYILILPSGFCEEFSVLDCALAYQVLWGGEILTVYRASALEALTA